MNMVGLITFLLYFVFFIPIIIRGVKAGGEPLQINEVKKPLIIAGIGIVVVSLFLALIDFDVAFMWFKSLNFLPAFLTRVSWQIILYVVGFFFSWGIFSLFFYIPKRREELETGEKIVKYSKILIPIILAFFSAGTLSSHFMTILMYFNRYTSSVSDPIFGKSVSFYMFSYPFFSTLISYLIGIFVVAFIIEEGVYWFYIKDNFHPQSDASRRATNLLSIVGGILFVLVGFKIYINIYSLLLSSRGAVFGIGYTDYHIRVPLFKLLAAIFCAGGIFLFIYAIFPRFTRRDTVIKVLVIGISAGLLLYGILPSLYQTLGVKPNELTKELSYLEYNIYGTRQGYDLAKIELKAFPDIKPLTLDDVKTEKVLTDNIRLWDWRALNDTYHQIQAIRLYYTFKDVDVDRYYVDGEYRQVMIAARELDHELLPANSQSWVNLHLKYTHGYGICMNTVNEFTPDGLPKLLIKDIPPVSSIEGVTVKRPEIYFGETNNGYVFVNTKTLEFDYPSGEENAYATYQGDGGVAISPVSRFIFAIHYNDASILLSRYLTSDSKIMINRNITDRVKRIAPFLMYDRDPYIVLGDDGKLYWMGDAFAYSSLYPYSEMIGINGKGINYMRNSVKYVVDPYSGKVHFYIIDDNDPVIQTYKNIFPSLFKDISDMPQFLVKHLRYPDDFMQLQGEIYTVYHMNDPEVFYNKEDKWQIATEKYRTSTQQVLPYFMILENRDTGKYEFVSNYPFTPSGKNNLIAIAIAQCDPENYGEVAVYQFSKEKLFYGPLQIEARVDQNSDMSKVLTLWNQQGSEVIRGNMLALPVKDSILYIEPVYLQASTSKFPQLKKVVVATQTKLVWGDTFDEAISLLFSGYQKPPEEPGEEVTTSELISSAFEHIEKYKQYMGEGEFELAGKELQIVEDILNQLYQERENP
ncbi:MAG: UPF0182 family protein [Caldisericaceae bacterium]|nr:UPF0182 family protein [Caldisericaceae bacterium]